ncbi:MAG: phosphoribosylformylglycinamidine synthase subunit PurS [Candidatus Methanofastidiosa archaeon]|nr:phosphoribosylformylglycinamidine synthase subunit PurS [Candidatus Methanofastidiosa archaeon]
METKDVIVNVGLKKGISDPEGNNIKKALRLLGFDEVEEVHVNKYFKITIKASDEDKAKERVREMAEKLLTNPVIHDYEIRW